MTFDKTGWIDVQTNNPSVTQAHAFVVRIWWEPGLSRLNGGPLWRGYVQHAASGQTLIFQSLGELLGFIQNHTGELDLVGSTTGDP